MVYKFDPISWNGTIFLLAEWHMSGDHLEYRRANKPIPASYFPKSLTVDEAAQALPDIFHTYRGLIVFSERARALMEERAPGQVEFIPVAIHAEPDIARQLQLASAYYFINVLGRAQRFQWLEMPVDPFPIREDGIQRFGTKHDYLQWKLRPRLSGEPLIWRESWWQVDNKEYRGHVDVLVEDILWHELDAKFPDQLNPMQVGTSIAPSPELSV
ncbi:hypothetical protein [Acidisphaera sp. S103]|uniref:hypothetical protein n=1 Tax=Acidisphaera sp. S103 TaxID=1747223 RepID=UPI00131BBC67|nr:hypothetical protein [Acidisphaera sp. S103]